MRWLREDGQWLFAGCAGAAAVLAVCLTATLLIAYLFGFAVLPTRTIVPAQTPALPSPPASSPPTPTSPIPPSPSPTQPTGNTPQATGNTIVFTCFNEGFDDICSLDPEGDEVRRLTDARATDFYPEISPLGDAITFSSRRSGAFRIYLMDPDGSNVRQVGPDHGSHFAPDISPDGAQIVFAYAASNEAGDTQHIWVMNIDGSEARPLTTGPHNDVDPVWSPDGAQIAFASDRGWRPAHWIMDADGGNMRMLPDGVPEHGGRSDWSPDGQWLAFYAGPRQARDIYLVATDGSGQWRRLTSSGRNLAPAYSPDGQWIVFTSYREEDNANLFIMRPDGSDVRQLTSDPRADWQPRWGPNQPQAGRQPERSEGSPPTILWRQPHQQQDGHAQRQSHVNPFDLIPPALHHSTSFNKLCRTL